MCNLIVFNLILKHEFCKWQCHVSVSKGWTLLRAYFQSRPETSQLGVSGNETCDLVYSEFLQEFIGQLTPRITESERSMAQNWKPSNGMSFYNDRLSSFLFHPCLCFHFFHLLSRRKHFQFPHTYICFPNYHQALQNRNKIYSCISSLEA